MCEHHQHHSHNHELPFYDFFGMGEAGVILTLLINGMLGSFSHCIGMCGPFALNISSMRLMEVPHSKMSQFSKIKALFAAPYYFGKATTYSIAAAIFYLLSEMLKNIPLAKYLGFILLVLVALAFVVMAIQQSVSLGLKLGGLTHKITKFIESAMKKIGSQYGWRGFVTGMVLGLIPCGLVVASITTATTYSDSLATVIAAVFLFGIATIPGLFLVSLLGGVAQSMRSKKTFKIAYSAFMLFNAYLLVSYAVRLL